MRQSAVLSEASLLAREVIPLFFFREPQGEAASDAERCYDGFLAAYSAFYRLRERSGVQRCAFALRSSPPTHAPTAEIGKFFGLSSLPR